MQTKSSTAKPTAARVLSRQHFAFMRALVQGLDERRSWDQYLAVEGEHTDLRTVRATITWIRDAFAAAARRENRPGTARLILLDAERLSTVPEATPAVVATPPLNTGVATAVPAPLPASQPKPLPTLEEFAAEHGMEDFSEDEQIEAYQLAYPTPSAAPVTAPATMLAVAGESGTADPEPVSTGKGGVDRRLARRARMITRQLDALRWLENLVAQDPRPGDGVGAWLNPSLASRLERSGMPTLFTLVERINGIGARWWLHVPGVGERKARRILEWLRDHEATLGMSVGSHVAQRRSALTPAALKAVVPASTTIVPFEKFIIPSELDGTQGQFRGPPQQCLLMARNDYEAIAAWLSTKQAAEGEPLRGAHEPHADLNAPASTIEPRLSATQRAYRKEAERLLLWAVLVRGKPLSSLSVEDATAYRGFLAAPPPEWCGPRHHQRWSPLWRPLEGPLSAVAVRYSLSILRSLYGFWMAQNYVVGNPFAGVAKPANPQRPLGSSRTLTFAQWDHLNGQLDQLVGAGLAAVGEATEVQRRLRRAMRWLYATGLRLAEVTGAQCKHLEPLEYRTADGATKTGWLLQVLGKGNRLRQVPVPIDLVAEFQQELARQGLEPQVGAVANQNLFILSRFDPKLAEPVPWSASGLYKAIKALVEESAKTMDGCDAEQLRRASTHWLRHSHGSHALQGRAGRTPVPIQVVQNNLGHASLGTTSQYLTTERESRMAAMEVFWEGQAQPGAENT